MLKELSSAIKKLRLSKHQKMIAGNQLTKSEQQSLVLFTAMILVPPLITGLIVLIQNIDFKPLS